MITIADREFSIRPIGAMEKFNAMEILRAGFASEWSRHPMMHMSPADILLMLPAPILETLRRGLFAQVDCAIAGQRAQPLLGAEDVCFQGLRPAVVYDVMLGVWDANFADFNSDLAELAQMLTASGMEKMSAQQEVGIGDVTFRFMEFKGFAGFQTLEVIRTALGQAKENWSQNLANTVRPMSAPEMVLHVPIDAMAQVRNRLFDAVSYHRDDGEAGRLLGNEDVAFAHLGAGAVYRVMARAAAVNFSDSYHEILQSMNTAATAMSPLLQNLFIRSFPQLLTPDLQATLIAGDHLTLCEIAEIQEILIVRVENQRREREAAERSSRAHR